jgi:quercetin 2,3-dioxygenase
MKTITHIASAPMRHWVGDGFPVRSMFHPQDNPQHFSPFLLLDYAAPTEFPPNLSRHRRGVGPHPHRGFETVTIVYAGEVEHRDSTGQGGVIGPGDVQWMTAGQGILHEEFHSSRYSQSGGPFQMVQLWVNLPASRKLAKPGYQAIMNESIPSVALGEPPDCGQIRVIAGEFNGVIGPARTWTPMNVLDMQLPPGQPLALTQPAGWNTMLMVVKGRVRVNDAAPVDASQLVTLSRSGQRIELACEEPVRLLLLSGAPIEEPVVAQGPFVMNTRQEIVQAILDFNAGQFGTLQSINESA